jgi:dihydroorotate dehydrogenase
MGKIRDRISGWLYRHLLKPVFFMQDPEDVHDRMSNMGEFLGSYGFTNRLTRIMFGFESKMLEQNVAGINFKNPIGLAAGFDKDAKLTQILPAVGFGFEEIGSITAKAYQGNQKPRLYRLPERLSLRVNYGLKNFGAEAVYDKLKKLSFSFPVGISIAKTNSQETSQVPMGIDDYFFTFKKFQDLGDYFTINISCPNTCEEKPVFAEPENLNLLLTKLFSMPKIKPIFIKLSPDLPDIQLNKILEVCREYPLDGFVCTNLTKINNFNHQGKGGFSGKAVEELTNQLISKVYKYYGGNKIIIGCGGVFNAKDAYKKIRLGSSLIQLITGMIFEGPQLIGEVNRDLSKLLLNDGFKNIQEAVGVDSKA